MAIALPIAEPRRRGACPTLDTPMPTGDGLLARIRVQEARLTPAQLAAIADLAATHGNGLVEITARGNLQVRGLTAVSAAPFARAIEALVPVERGLVVETPPLAGEDPAEVADPRPLASAIRHLSGPFEPRLGPKVTVIVDGRGQISLGALKADIRLTAVTSDRWHLIFGDGSAQAVTTAEAPVRVATLLGRLAALGPEARASDLQPGAPRAPAPSAPPIGSHRRLGGTATGIALPFGSSDAAALSDLAREAEALSVPEFRLAPHHALLALDAPPSFSAVAAALGFITDPSDPRLRISACAGSAGCASGYIPARAIAARLAPHLPPGQHLHVSGCSKGCAHPRPAGLTLVGNATGYGLVFDGRAGDTPRMQLSDDQIESAIAAAPSLG
ncbi:precorrin-3B synthase [Devosia albogilva]|uniref:Precorrin-3B synthase n=1 Tax=Devosia albogilva TaxID=429726 RepID=A0ABW5QMH9_9HYPH